MEKTIVISGKDVKFKSTGALLLRYRMQFRKDALKDIFKIYSSIRGENNSIDLENLDLEVFQQLAWTMAKTADPTIPEIFEWLDSFEEFPLIDIIMDVIELLDGCLTTIKKK